MLPKLVELEWQGDPPNLYCPACGTPIYEMHKEPEICQHILVTYLDQFEAFDYLNEKIKETGQRIIGLQRMKILTQ